MKLKQGVSLRGMKWQTFYMLIIVDGVHKRMFSKEVVVTSGTEGEHKHDTHGLGYAGDCRSRDHTTEQRDAFVKAVKKELPEGYEFFHEMAPAHYHGEYDPRATKEVVE